MSCEPMASYYDQRISGLVNGIVSGVVDPDGIGRVRVTLPWYASGYDVWARVSQLYAGSGYGSTWIPEVDTEVLVAFAHGDMRFPYVVGCLHSEVDAPPVSRTDSSDVKTLRTPAGSELSFDETNGTIDLKTPSGASIKLEENAGAITLESATKIDLKAPEITISGSSKVTINGATVAIN
jgi:uncharacterized protein involved in type VI secretion and phage assembly